MHAAALQMQTTTLPRAGQTAWLSNKKLCLRSGPNKSKAPGILCTSSLQHDNTSASQRRPTQIKAAAADTLVKTAAADVHTNEAPNKSPHSDSDKQHFDWHNQWYAVGYERDFDEAKPNAFTLLGEQICIWKDSSNKWQAFLDICPHRLIPLSEGRITDAKELQCAYHGWCFDAAGKCTAIPQGGNINNPRTSATVYQASVKQGLLWVKPTALPKARRSSNGAGVPVVDDSDIPILPEIEEGWIDSATFRDLPYDYATLLENLFDVGHVPFTHHASVSKRSSADVITLNVKQQGPTGFVGRNERGPRKGQLGAQDTVFGAPCLMRHTIDAQDKKGFSNITAVYATPIAPGRSRAIIRNLFKFKSPIPRFFFKLVPQWSTHVGNNTVLEDDVVFLHKQEELAVARGLGRKPVAQVYHMPGSSDNFVTAFRTWLSKYGGGGPFGAMDSTWLQAAGPRLEKDLLLDRFHSHTANCKVCSATLHNVQKARTVLKYSVGVLAVAAAILAAVALSAANGPTQQELQQQLQGKGIWSAAGQLVLQLGRKALGSSSPSGMMASAAVCVGLSVVLLAGRGYLEKTERKFIHGVYPPPRNVKQQHDEAQSTS